MAKENPKKVKKEKRAGARMKGFLKGLLVGILVGAILAISYASIFKINFRQKVNSGKEFVDLLLNGNRLGYTAVDFQDAVLGQASEHKEFIVMEQPLEISSTLTKAGLGNLAIFSKTKNITYSGTGVYVVDLSKLRADKISVDQEKKTVTISVPHAALQYVVCDRENIKFEDTEKGLLAFGEIRMTAEEENEIEKEVNARMETRLRESDLMQKADNYALRRCRELFDPFIKAVDAEFKTVIEFEQ